MAHDMTALAPRRHPDPKEGTGHLAGTCLLLPRGIFQAQHTAWHQETINTCTPLSPSQTSQTLSLCLVEQGFGVCCAFWMCIFMLFIKFGQVLPIISSCIISAFSTHSGIPIMQVWAHLMVYPRSLRLSSLFFMLCSFCSSHWIISSNLCSSLLVLSLLVQICKRAPPAIFHFSCCTLSFLFGSFVK